MSSTSDQQEIYYISWPTSRIVSGKPLPEDIYVCIRHRMVKYKNVEDELSGSEFDKLVYNQVRYLFIREEQKSKFENWYLGVEREEDPANVAAEGGPDAEVKKEIAASVKDTRRAALDLFTNPGGSDQVLNAVNTSKKMVTEFLKKPFVAINLSQIQKYGRGVVDHSVNVSVLSVYLGLRLGYSSKVILEHLAIGGLMHDLGKALVAKMADKELEEDDPAFLEHPILAKQAMDPKSAHQASDFSKEVQMIVAQHHEYLDGTGYPNKIRGLAVYDLARVVTIANEYDNLVSKAEGETIAERMDKALQSLENDFEGKLDNKKLDKCIRALKESIGQ